MMLARWTLLVGMTSLLAFACASPSTSADDVPDDDIATDEELTGASDKLAGAYQEGGERVVPAVTSLVLARNRTFVAVFDNGLRLGCRPGRCPPTGVEVAGSFSAGTKFLTLTPAPGAERSPYHGRYAYTFEGGTLTLRRQSSPFRAGWGQALRRTN